MAPPDRPPYTKEEIESMKTADEKMRAVAELSSYIARKKKEKEDRLARESQTSNEYSGHALEHPRQPFYPNTGAPYAGSYNGYGRSPAGPYRRGNSHGRGGPQAYHPYQRPSYPAQTYRNKSVTFNNHGLSDDLLENKGDDGFPSNNTLGPRVQQRIEPQTLCAAFTSTGLCSRHGCQHKHDTDKQAICKRWLYKGECPKGDSCPLSHEPSPHNSPTCQHFQDSRCNNDTCRWSHVRINPAAPTCEAFGIMGYCEKGADCSDLHARECPTFSNTGHCRYGDKCRLGHVHRASRMRKAARLSSDGPSSEASTPKEAFDDSTDSEAWTGGAAHDPHQFSQQVDFVSLNAED